jgi:hypothetical protein
MDTDEDSKVELVEKHKTNTIDEYVSGELKAATELNDLIATEASFKELSRLSNILSIVEILIYIAFACIFIYITDYPNECYNTFWHRLHNDLLVVKEINIELLEALGN